MYEMHCMNSQYTAIAYTMHSCIGSHIIQLPHSGYSIHAYTHMAITE